MVQRDHLANLLNHLVNNRKVRKYNCTFSPYNKTVVSVLEIMKKQEFIKGYKAIENDTGGELEIEIDKLNLCRAIKPRFSVKKDGYDKFVRRFLPSRDIGIIIVSTNQGLMTHKEAIEKDLGGKLIAYCY